MGPVYSVIPNTVPVALQPHWVDIQGKQGFCGVEQRLAVQWNLRNIAWSSPASPLDLLPLFWGVLDLLGLLGPPERPAFDFSETLLTLALPKRH